ncbi:MAG TPA: hypothetical protein VHK01_09185, partial [Lacipirellulaceae bacterium]|nr:hypothetical protein [Lacipirellulaceae bacterium]
MPATLFSMFELFDPKEEFFVRHGNLPHWYQPGVTYFVTFRLDDSVPQALARSWHAQRDYWLRANGIDIAPNWKIQLAAAPDLER